MFTTCMTLIGNPVSFANCSRICRVGFGVCANAVFKISSCLALIVVRGPRRLLPTLLSSGDLFSVCESLVSVSPSMDPSESFSESFSVGMSTELGGALSMAGVVAARRLLLFASVGAGFGGGVSSSSSSSEPEPSNESVEEKEKTKQSLILPNEIYKFLLITKETSFNLNRFLEYIFKKTFWKWVQSRPPERY